MIELKYHSITNPALIDAMTSLMAHKGFPTKLAYNIARIADKIDQASNRIKEEYFALAKEHGVVDAKGLPIKDLSDEKKEAWSKTHKEFDQKVFKIERHRLNASDIEAVGLTPQELFAISGFVDGLDEEKRHLKEVSK